MSDLIRADNLRNKILRIEPCDCGANHWVPNEGMYECYYCAAQRPAIWKENFDLRRQVEKLHSEAESRCSQCETREIEFTDAAGNVYKLKYNDGDSSIGTSGGWVCDEEFLAAGIIKDMDAKKGVTIAQIQKVLEHLQNQLVEASNRYELRNDYIARLEQAVIKLLLTYKKSHQSHVQNDCKCITCRLIKEVDRITEGGRP